MCVLHYKHCTQQQACSPSRPCAARSKCSSCEGSKQYTGTKLAPAVAAFCKPGWSSNLKSCLNHTYSTFTACKATLCKCGQFNGVQLVMLSMRPTSVGPPTTFDVVACIFARTRLQPKAAARIGRAAKTTCAMISCRSNDDAKYMDLPKGDGYVPHAAFQGVELPCGDEDASYHKHLNRYCG